MLAGDDEERLAKLKGEYEAIDEAMIYNHCYSHGRNGTDYIKAAQEKKFENNVKKESSDSEVSLN